MRESTRWMGGIFLMAVLGLACSGGGGGGPKTCSGPEQCGALEHCVAGTCVSDAPPAAAFAPPDAAVANDLVQLDGSASQDPDADDRVAGYAWRFASAADAPCEAPAPMAGTAPTAHVRFGCAGTYKIQLVVTDQKGVASAPLEHEIAIEPRQGDPLLTAGPDVTVGHTCATPTSCGLAEAVTLSAQSHVTGAIGPVRLQWTIDPPAGRSLDASRHVVLDATAATTSLEITTAGTAISGEWIFRVTARDDAGVLGTAAQKVTVTNRAPRVVWTAPAPYPHTFASNAFQVSGTLPFTLVDDDGDPLGEPQLVFRHTGDGGATFTGALTADGASFSIAVPYGGAASAGYLIDGAELSRSIQVTVTDVNGASTVSSQPILVGNRPPAISTDGFATSANHAFDGTAYVAFADLGKASDPDGDPLLIGDPSGDAVCTSSLQPNAAVRVSCRKAFQAVTDLVAFAKPHPVKLSVRDPWTTASVQPTLTVLNRAPVLTPSMGTALTACTTGICCEHLDTKTCVAWQTSYASVSYGYRPAPTDPDGDPLTVTVDKATAPSTLCASQCQVFSATIAAPSTCGAGAVAPWKVSATDGIASATATHDVNVECK